MNQASPPASCPVCGGTTEPALVRAGCTYRRCETCAFLFWRPDATDGTPDAIAYDETYWRHEREEALRRQRTDCVVRAFEAIWESGVPVERLLDFGCGHGATVALLRDMLDLDAVGVDPYGEFEPSEWLLKADLDELRARFEPASFDAMISVEVFEHLVDPVRALETLAGLLRPGGVLVITTGTQEWLAHRDPEMTYVDPARRGHISIFSIRTFELLAERFGLESRVYERDEFIVTLSKGPSGDEPRPLPANTALLARAGEWVPLLVQQHMSFRRLQERNHQRSAWALRMQEELRDLRAKAPDRE